MSSFLMLQGKRNRPPSYKLDKLQAGQATREGFQANTSTVKGTAQAFEMAALS